MDRTETIATTKSIKHAVDNLVRGFEKERKRLAKLEDKATQQIGRIDTKLGELRNKATLEPDATKRAKLDEQINNLDDERDNVPNYEYALELLGEYSDTADTSVLGRLSQISCDLEALLDRKEGQYATFFKERKDAEG